jgi:hypothetical protein
VNDGFSPRELDPSSNDPRFLGIWIEVRSSSPRAGTSLLERP